MEFTFPVQRRFLFILGWAFIVLGVSALVAITIGGEHNPLWEIVGIISCIPIGMLMLRAVRNVREIRIDEHRLVFKPVGAELPLSDIRSISLPDRADRDDARPNRVGILAVKTFSNTTRLVLGAVVQRPRTCIIYLHGSDSVRLIQLLQDRIACQPDGEKDPLAK